MLSPGTVASPVRPKLRSDLIVRAHNSADGKPFVVKDPVSQQFFGLREVEHFVVEQLDGDTPLDVIQRRVEERFGSSLETETLVRFVQTLRELGLLENTTPERAPAPPGRLQGNALYLRVRLFDPNRLLGWLVEPTRPFFTRGFLAVSATLISLAILVSAASSRELARAVAGLFQLDSVPLVLFAVVVVGMAHELAHGVACRRHGGQVHDIGFMLIYFTPAFYCNVSDTWLFPEKSRRLLVTFAGVYLELFIWALATLAWRVTDGGTWINLLAIVIMATSGVKTLFNLNPLIKLDGYYLLSDALGIPNLRRRAFAHIGGLLARRGTAPDTVPPTPYERRIFFWYGLTAAIYSFLLLGAIIVQVGGFLVARYQAAGLLLLALLVAPRLRRRLRSFTPRRSKVFQRPPTVRASDGDGETSEETEEGEGERTRRGRRERRWGRRLGLAVLAVLAVVLLIVGRMDLRVAGEFTVLPADRGDVRSVVEGIIVSIEMDEGARVRKGDVVVRLADRDRAAELIGVQTELAEKQAMLRLLRAGATREQRELVAREVTTAEARRAYTEKRLAEARQMRSERIVKLQTTVKKTEESLGYKRGQFERFRDLAGAQLISRKQLEDAEELMVVTGRELEEARAELAVIMADDLGDIRKELALAQTHVAEAKGKQAVLLAGNRPEEIEARQAEIARLQAKREHLEESSRLLLVTSPIDGVITTPSRQLRQMVGHNVAKGDLLATVQNLGTVMAEIAVPEKEIADVKVGHPVLVKLRAYPNETFEGRVTTIATSVRTTDAAGPTPKDAPAPPRAPDEGAGDRVVLVTSEIQNPALLLKPDMTGRAKIYCGEQPLYQLLTRRLARIVRIELWSWW